MASPCSHADTGCRRPPIRGLPLFGLARLHLGGGHQVAGCPCGGALGGARIMVRRQQALPPIQMIQGLGFRIQHTSLSLLVCTSCSTWTSSKKRVAGAVNCAPVVATYWHDCIGALCMCNQHTSAST